MSVWIGSWGVVDRQHALGALFDRAQAGIGGDRVEPGAQGASAFEPDEPAPRAQERVLQRVLGVSQRSEHPVAVRAELRRVRSDELCKPNLVVAAVASIAAGAIHATAAGAHSEHRAAVVVFAVLAAFQIGWGALALAGHRGWRWVALLGAAGNTAAIGGWALAKTAGIGFVTGLEDAESPQLADTLAAALAAVAVLGALLPLTKRLAALRRSGERNSPALVGAAAFAALAVGVPGMVAAGSHSHAHGESETSGQGHEHRSSETPSQPYDATLPVDFSGVEGVTAEQQTEAEELATVTIQRLPQWADTATAYAAGFRSVGDAGTGFEHYINWASINDDTLFDPDHPESLVYRVDGERRTLVAAMYMLPDGTGLDGVPDLGGDLIQWHVHNDLCYAGEENAWVFADQAPAGQACPEGTFRLIETAPMIHVWIVPHECGAFASLDGVGGGQVAEGEDRACDHVHGSTAPDAISDDDSD
jgi:hypothetical protein